MHPYGICCCDMALPLQMVCGCVAACLAAPQRLNNNRQQLQTPTTTPVPILRQISSSNEDGSYTYGYEAADGSFKLETRRANGEVFGKYGYVDSNGELRTVEYGVDKFGFQPKGKGIEVAPPSLVDETVDYDYVDTAEPAPAATPTRASVRSAPATIRVAASPPVPAPQPIAENTFQTNFADFDARIAQLFTVNRN